MHHEAKTNILRTNVEVQANQNRQLKYADRNMEGFLSKVAYTKI